MPDSESESRPGARPVTAPHQVAFRRNAREGSVFVTNERHMRMYRRYVLLHRSGRFPGTGGEGRQNEKKGKNVQ